MIVGLTGGIGSGKTTIANIFQQEFSIDIVDADVVAREVVEPGTPGLLAISQHFGESILTPQGELDRAQLRDRIFSQSQEKQWVNDLLHPLIRQRIDLLLSQTTSPYALLVVPLLIENNWQKNIDRLLVVDVSPDTQISRTSQRDHVPESQVRAILAAQASREERLKHADDVINNDAPLNDGRKQQIFSKITELHKKYLALSH
ncbi:dephospho-CoA kinase [Vibrio rumoiensis]|uniref:Dephospho-CoA kinase n=1 Tax=Vibrio rumoiensis 1S-45 TaxID=1188252 RepID=A0A1E5E1F2_9VIBR|nr:dephospho-CoA kinase [Vibrio rumoiensis]OEF24967.1 dephospho-CoA kinase [Vibrio rumoiensis 1S-45]